uniref:tRNA(Ile)-lysidine synthase n=1 Tax=Candidatus Aschnera chinzeii TaxID=1485666 RepID=A0AAT9G400_9ENTR|nr:MAG: tRNA lysidine(34) synthetase TilS [Candidatus Aschnera chinzeii]
MDIFHSKIIKSIIKTIGSIRKILVGFSGGLDSTVLLHALIMIRNHLIPNLDIRAIYINHGISKYSKVWGRHCKIICTKWNVIYCVHNININTDKKGIESAARYARYKVFHEICLPNEVIFTAHQLNDQVETFLLFLKRGSGPAGLSGMSKFTPFYNTYLVRPLLSFQRNELLAYAIKNNLTWIDDDSNSNSNYDRNFLRLNIIPLLIKRWPFFLSSVFRTAKICKEEQLLLCEALKDTLSTVINSDGSLNISMLLTHSDVKKYFILRYWFKLHNMLMPSYVQLKCILYEVVCAKLDANPKLILSDHVIRRYRNKLWITRNYQDISQVCLIWQLPNTIVLPDNLGALQVSNHGFSYRCPNINEIVSIRFGLKGKIKIVGRLHSRHSKKLWQEFGIAPWLRNRIPLLYYNDTLIAAIGVFITEYGGNYNSNSVLNIQWLSK